MHLLFQAAQSRFVLKHGEQEEEEEEDMKEARHLGRVVGEEEVGGEPLAPNASQLFQERPTLSLLVVAAREEQVYTEAEGLRIQAQLAVLPVWAHFFLRQVALVDPEEVLKDHLVPVAQAETEVLVLLSIPHQAETDQLEVIIRAGFHTLEARGELEETEALGVPGLLEHSLPILREVVELVQVHRELGLLGLQAV